MIDEKIYHFGKDVWNSVNLTVLVKALFDG